MIAISGWWCKRPFLQHIIEKSSYALIQTQKGHSLTKLTTIIASIKYGQKRTDPVREFLKEQLIKLATVKRGK